MPGETDQLTEERAHHVGQCSICKYLGGIMDELVSAVHELTIIAMSAMNDLPESKRNWTHQRLLEVSAALKDATARAEKERP